MKPLPITEEHGRYNGMTEILDIANQMAQDLFKAGAMNEITMHTMDALCLPPKRSFRPEDIRRIRTANHVSQAAFAVFLGISKTTDGAAVGTGTKETKRRSATPS